ncbi:MAG: hypothetical protein HW380_1524 [Magnetococcales bacterium]|nr:hypothetical protein [Magnetococcales bacterium]HIJ83028.1 hypothetical protein [Magnetococcales bacterium]
MGFGQSMKTRLRQAWNAFVVCGWMSWLLAGCAIESYRPSLIEFTYPAADQLVFNLGRGIDQQLNPLRMDRPLLVASFVELDRLEKTSTFGRLVAEQMASRLTQKGFSLIELKLREQLYIQSGAGEFALSRELQKISRERDAQALLVGTYSQVNDFVYVSAKIVRSDGHVYAAHDFAIPRGHLVEPIVKGRYDDWNNPKR